MEYKVLLEIIEKAAEEGETELDLSRSQIRELPSEIGQLTNLKQLDLSFNQLSTLPPEIVNLTKLNILRLKSNRLRELPSSIGQLGNLTELYLQDNQLKELPEDFSKLNELEVLNLGENELSKLPTDTNQLKSLRKLILNANKFIEIPHELSQLPNLSFLYFWSNLLSELGPEIGQLQKMTNLSLSSNELSSVPPEIGNLTNLTALDLSYNNLNTLPREIGLLTDLTTLNLSDNQISALPPAISQLYNLKVIDLSRNKLDTLPEEIGRLSSLTELLIAENRLSKIPIEIGKLINLKNLVFYKNVLKELPPDIGELSYLKNLDVRRNYITKIPPEIGKLKNLEILLIGRNSISTLPEEFAQLSCLTELYLWGNGFSVFPAEITQLSNLTKLNFWDNRLTELPPEIGQMTSLNSLDFSNNRLNELPPELGKLTDLEELYLNDNQLSSLPQEIGELKNLVELTLRNNQLKYLPQEIGELSNLKEINLRGNNLATIPAELGQLNNLTELDLRNNQLSTLPTEIGQLKDSLILKLLNNPLESPPPEIAEQGVSAIRDYFRQLEAEGVDHVFEAKLLIVGEAGAGKTTLAKKILNPNYKLQEETSTAGIDVMQWEFTINGGQPFRLNIWDFGGQAIYHATHQFFLTKRSLYALVADTRKEDTDFFYWLNVVELLSENSPLLIVKNEKQDRHREINESQLRGRFSNLKDTLSTNLATNRGFERVIEAIKYHAGDLPHIGNPLPRTWVKVRQKLEEEAKNRNYISLVEFLDICKENGFGRREDALQLSNYLHDLGVCLYFQDDPLLKKVVILKPEWSTDAVYLVLDNPNVIRNLGQFRHHDLEDIWQGEMYDDMHDELLQMMMKFQLCYEIPGKRGSYIAPQLLTENQPNYEWDESDNLLLRYAYEFMPKGIVTRFIVAMHQFIANQESVWKSGVVLEMDNTKVDVVEDYERRAIKIRVSGKNKRDVLTIVMHELDKIHSLFRLLKYDKLIPCNCSKCTKKPEPYFYRFESLKRRVNKNRYEIECDKSFEMVDIYRLIDDVNVRREIFPDDEQESEKKYTIYGPVVFQEEGSTTIMEQHVRKEKVVEIGEDAQISAPIVIADAIQSSFNTLAESKVDEDIKVLLEDLLKVVNEVNKDIPEEQKDAAEEMARDAETLVKEAASSKPRQKWYEVSIDGLEQAAKNIGRVAKPVLEIVGELRKALLGV